MNNKRYRINHHDEYKQAKKAMEYMKKRRIMITELYIQIEDYMKSCEKETV